MSRLLILANKLGYQTRSFAEAARALGIEVVFASDRCHQLEDPWSDGAIALHFDRPEEAARRIVAQSLGRPDRPGRPADHDGCLRCARSWSGLQSSGGRRELPQQTSAARNSARSRPSGARIFLLS